MKELTWSEVRAADRGATAVSYLPDSILDLLWERFSNIQAASELVKSQESVDRFLKWLETGNDEDAWS